MRHDDYPLLRGGLGVDYAELGDEALNELVQEVYGPAFTAEDVESFWSNVGSGFKDVGNALGKALPDIGRGAAAGSAFGPWGALVGGVAGAASGLMGQSKNKTVRDIGSAVSTGGRLVSNFGGGGMFSKAAGAAVGGLGPSAGSSAGGVSGGSTGALMALLSRPETLRALMSSTLGAYGRRNVVVGNQPVAAQSIMSAIATLAGRSAQEMVPAGESVPRYFYDSDGELAIDPADADQRADALLALLALTAPRWFGGASNDTRGEVEAIDEYTEDLAEADAWLMTESSLYETTEAAYD